LFILEANMGTLKLGNASGSQKSGAANSEECVSRIKVRLGKLKEYAGRVKERRKRKSDTFKKS
jgi:hypothetical protein